MTRPTLCCTVDVDCPLPAVELVVDVNGFPKDAACKQHVGGLSIVNDDRGTIPLPFDPNAERDPSDIRLHSDAAHELVQRATERLSHGYSGPITDIATAVSELADAVARLAVRS